MDEVNNNDVIPTTKTETRRAFLKKAPLRLIGAKTAIDLGIKTALVSIAAALVDPYDAASALEKFTEVLPHIAKGLDKSVVDRVAKELPQYPVDVLAENPHYSPLQEEFKKAISSLKEKGIKPKWYFHEQFVDRGTVRSIVPNFLQLLLESRDGLPAIFNGVESMPKRLANDPKTPLELKDILFISDHGLRDLDGIDFIKPSSFRKNTFQQEIEEVKSFIEQERLKNGKPVSPTKVFSYFAEKNDGDLVKATADSYLAFLLLSRHDHVSGQRLDRPGLWRNHEWMRENIADVFRFGNASLMPKPEDFGLRGGGAELYDDNVLEFEIDPVNQWGTIYHFFNNLLLCHYIDAYAPINGSITRTMGAGYLKLAREINASSALPQILDIFDQYKDS